MWLLTATTVFRKTTVWVVQETFTDIPWNQTSCKSEQKMYDSPGTPAVTNTTVDKPKWVYRCRIFWNLVSRAKGSVKLITSENKFWPYREDIKEWRIKLNIGLMSSFVFFTSPQVKFYRSHEIYYDRVCKKFDTRLEKTNHKNKFNRKLWEYRPLVTSRHIYIYIYIYGMILTFKPRIKSHLLFAGIIRSSPFSPL